MCSVSIKRQQERVRMVLSRNVRHHRSHKDFAGRFKVVKKLSFEKFQLSYSLPSNFLGGCLSKLNESMRLQFIVTLGQTKFRSVRLSNKIHVNGIFILYRLKLGVEAAEK